MTEPIGIGAATALCSQAIDHSRPPHWLRVYRVDRRSERIACLRCVESEVLQVVDRDVYLVIRDLERFQAAHWCCSSQPEVPR